MGLEVSSAHSLLLWRCRSMPSAVFLQAAPLLSKITRNHRISQNIQRFCNSKCYGLKEWRSRWRLSSIGWIKKNQISSLMPRSCHTRVAVITSFHRWNHVHVNVPATIIIESFYCSVYVSESYRRTWLYSRTPCNRGSLEHKVMLICRILTAHYPKVLNWLCTFWYIYWFSFYNHVFLVFAAQTLTRASYTLLHELNLITRTV